jgi:uncharacterized membrane protein
MMAAMVRIRLLVAALWAGSLWTVGYLVAPTLFLELNNKALAGTIAGLMFRGEAWLSIACALLMLLLLGFSQDMPVRLRNILGRVTLLMLVLTIASHYGITPRMEALRALAGPDGVMDPAIRARFGVLHGASSVIYLVQSVLAGFLLWKQK